MNVRVWWLRRQYERDRLRRILQMVRRAGIQYRVRTAEEQRRWA